MEKRHRKFFYAFLIFNCFLSPACNHEKHGDVHVQKIQYKVDKAHN
jgi:hypothetical protein